MFSSRGLAKWLPCWDSILRRITTFLGLEKNLMKIIPQPTLQCTAWLSGSLEERFTDIITSQGFPWLRHMTDVSWLFLFINLNNQCRKGWSSEFCAVVDVRAITPPRSYCCWVVLAIGVSLKSHEALMPMFCRIPPIQLKWKCFHKYCRRHCETSWLYTRQPQGDFSAIIVTMSGLPFLTTLIKYLS